MKVKNISPSSVAVILTFNSELIIEETVKQALKVCSKIFVVDSGSTDETIIILTRLGCEVVHRKFLNYSDQRNWAINAMSDYDWQLHLDADEVLDNLAIEEINKLLSGEVKPLHCAYMIKRRDYFMGKMLRHSGLNPWHLRLFKSGFAICEMRLYDQHFICSESVGRLKGLMHDKNKIPLSEWVMRHNRWSDLEAEELVLGQDKKNNHHLNGRIFGDPRERTRFFKNIYYTIPSCIRAPVYFLYRYFFCLAFLDGATGFYFSFFQGFWFRLLVDAKIDEYKNQASFKK